MAQKFLTGVEIEGTLDLNSVSTSSSSTSVLVLSSSTVAKRTLGSAAFVNTGAFVNWNLNANTVNVNSVDRTEFSANNTNGSTSNRPVNWATVYTLGGGFNALQLGTNEDYSESGLHVRQYNANSASPQGSGWQNWTEVWTTNHAALSKITNWDGAYTYSQVGHLPLAGGTMTGTSGVVFPDSFKLNLGTGSDLEIFHDGADSIINNNLGHLYITQKADDKDIIFRSDDGSGGITHYLTLDGSAGYTLANKDIYLVDDVRLRAGTGGDFSIFHDGSNSKINNNTGNIVIENFQNDGDIIFKSENGSGGTTEYFRVDGQYEVNRFLKNARFNDSVKANFGTGDDLQIQHTGTTAIVDNQTGDLIIKVSQDDGDIIFQSDNGSGGIDTYFRIDGGQTRTEFEKGTQHLDNVKGNFGSSSDMQIYHNGTTGNNNIENHGGNLYFTQYVDDGSIHFRNDDGSGGVEEYLRLDGSTKSIVVSAGLGMYFNDGVAGRFGNAGDMHLYHNGTHSFISNTTGDLNLHTNTGTFYLYNNADDGDISFQSDNGSGGIAEYLRLDGGITSLVASKDLLMAIDGNGGKLKFGASQDLQIFHDGTNSYLDNGTGNLYIRNLSDDKDINFLSDDGSGGDATYFRVDGSAVETRFLKSTLHFDSIKAQFGDSGDLQIYHSGSHSYIKDVGTGSLYLQTNGAAIYLQDTDGNAMAQFTDGGGSFLFYNSNLKLSTTNTGAAVTGDLIVSGNLTVEGTTTTINTATVEVEDNILQLNTTQGTGSNADTATAATSGISVYRGNGVTQASLIFDDADDTWDLTNNLKVGGTVLASEILFATLNGHAHIDSQSSSLMIEASNIQAMGNLIPDGNGNRPLGASNRYWSHLYANGITTKAINLTQTADVGELTTSNLDSGAAVGLSITYPTSNVAAGDGLAIAIGIAGRGRSYIANSNTSNNLDASNLEFYTENGGVIHKALTLDTSQNATFGGDVSLGDAKELIFGAATDFKIYHNNATNVNHVSSLIDRQLSINANIIQLTNQANSTTYLKLESTGATFAGKIVPNAHIELPYGSELRTLDSNGAARTIARASSNKLQYGWSYAGAVEFMGGGSYTPRITINTDGSTTFAGSVSAEDNIYLTDAGTVRAKLLLNASDRDNVELRAESLGSTMKFFTVGTEALELDANQNATFSGDVTATANYTSSNSKIIYKAQRSGGAVAGDWSYDDATTDMSLGTSTAHSFSLKTGNARALTINTDQNSTFAGKLGVGGAPASQLTVFSTTTSKYVRFRADNNEQRFEFYVGASGNASRMSMHNADATETIRFASAGVSYFNTGNNVAIGTATATAARLVVHTDSSDKPTLLLKNTAGHDSQILFEDNSGSTQNASIKFNQASQNTLTIETGYQSPSNTNRIYLAPAGHAVLTAIGGSGGASAAKVGIGSTTPIHKLYVNGDIGQTNGHRIWFRGSSSSSAVGAQSYIHSDGLNLKIKGDDNVRILGDGGGTIAHFDYTGKVGVGTLLPKSQLQVAGGIQMADDTDAASANKVGTMRYRTGTEYVEVTGAELAPNGDFNTTAHWGGSSSIANGRLTRTGGGLGYVSGTLTNGNYYRIVVDVVSLAGTLNVYANGTNSSALAVGINSFVIQAGSTNNLFGFNNGYAGSTGSVIESISAVQVTAEDASYADMCMQTGASTYEWVNIVKNTY